MLLSDVIEDVREYERQQETRALLKLLALGKNEVQAGKVQCCSVKVNLEC